MQLGIGIPPHGPLRSVDKRTISEVLIAVAGVTRFIRLLSYAVKTNMAPKTIRNLGDKSGGAKTTRIGKDKGEAAGANKRLTSIIGKAAGSNVSGSLRDAKTGNGKQWDKVVGKDPQLTDWGKDCSDKFYSLTEESDLSSVDHSFSESEGSETSEADNKSPSNELTVRQYRQRKTVRIRPGSHEGVENAASVSGRTLKWDFSGIDLIDIPTSGSQGLDNEKTENGASAGSPNNASMRGTEAGILQSIYNSIKELQTETRIECRRARIATKRLQGTVRKVAESCTEIEAKLCSMEERIMAVEEDVDTLKVQNAEKDGQVTDVLWKMEDLENRQRRNNIRFLGILEGVIERSCCSTSLTALVGKGDVRYYSVIYYALDTVGAGVRKHQMTYFM
ncbi:hypothetical protein NDU88_003559 [Pleurodeles waltl]|uniref:Uncharacterized protein n=1 Tax=Pleurodeles waltl TaxID=8319 RepID=A0AAV7LHE2_PLEWA|nr:hypothetical protein NDU88_003559 [Pleurodeles waltl]